MFFVFWDFVVLAGNITAFLGWFKWNSILCVAVGTAICLTDTLLRWKNLNANAKKMDVVMFLIGLSVGLLFNGLPKPYICGMLAINAFNILIHGFSVLSYISLLILSIARWIQLK